MTTKKDWLPANREALYEKAVHVSDYIQNGNNRDRMGFAATSPQGEWFDNVHQPKFDDFHQAFHNWKDPARRTKIITAKVNNAQKVFIPSFRQLYSGLLRDNPLVTDADLAAMGLPPRPSGKHTPVKVPKTYPEGEIVLPAPGVIEIHFHDFDSKSKAKPDGVHGAEIAWAILDAPTDDWRLLTQSVFDTHTPYILSFEGENRGKKLYFALRWENTRGEKGPWSPIYDAIIP